MGCPTRAIVWDRLGESHPPRWLLICGSPTGDSLPRLKVVGFLLLGRASVPCCATPPAGLPPQDYRGLTQSPRGRCEGVLRLDPAGPTLCRRASAERIQEAAKRLLGFAASPRAGVAGKLPLIPLFAVTAGLDPVASFPGSQKRAVPTLFTASRVVSGIIRVRQLHIRIAGGYNFLFTAGRTRAGSDRRSTQRSARRRRGDRCRSYPMPDAVRIG